MNHYSGSLEKMRKFFSQIKYFKVGSLLLRVGILIKNMEIGNVSRGWWKKKKEQKKWHPAGYERSEKPDLSGELWEMKQLHLLMNIQNIQKLSRCWQSMESYCPSLKRKRHWFRLLAKNGCSQRAHPLWIGKNNFSWFISKTRWLQLTHAASRHFCKFT